MIERKVGDKMIQFEMSVGEWMDAIVCFTDLSRSEGVCKVLSGMWVISMS